VYGFDGGIGHRALHPQHPSVLAAPVTLFEFLSGDG
jgi:hypothetical protein